MVLALVCCAAPAAWPGEWRVQGPQSQEILDPATRLVWRRCVEGMYWTGRSCEGQALALNWSEAQARARAMADADKQPWQLPSLSQLKTLSAFARSQPDVFASMFPQARAGWHWSGSSTVDNATVNPYDYGNVQRGIDASNVNRLAYRQAWAVELGGAQDTQENMARRSALHVRLVRRAP